MPVLVFAISENLDELFKNGSLTALASLRKLGGVMVMTIHTSIVFIVAVLSSKDSRAQRAGKVVDMIFPIECRDIGSP